MQVQRWQELIEAGRANPRPGVSAAGTDLCTIMYTSGTTGKPKARAIKAWKLYVPSPQLCVLLAAHCLWQRPARPSQL